ncbi:MAG: aldo/keto reductase [Verrucomicrobiota bacterium]
MQYNLFGNTGMNVSRLCLGTMTFPNTLNEKEAAGILDEALDCGVNFVDTADSYNKSEEVLGKIITPAKRDKIFLTSKVYRRFCRAGYVGANSRVNILNNIDRSLKLLQTDYLDLYLLHHPDPKTPVEETMRTLDDLVREGKIRYWGVSNHYAWQMAYMLGLSRERQLEPLVGYQAGYSIIDRQIEAEAVPMLEKFNVGLMVYSPLCGGILAGKYHSENGEIKTETPRGRKAFAKRIQDQRITEIVLQLRSFADEVGMSLNQLALAWLLNKSWVTTVLLGGSKPEQFTPMYEMADKQLPAEVEKKIDELSHFRIYSPLLNHPVKTGARLNINA